MPQPHVPDRHNSAVDMESVTWALTASMKSLLPTPISAQLGTPGTCTCTPPPSKRRVVYPHDISPHALERLGVDVATVKKEKGMKKLGICDSDLVQSEELRRYTGVSQILPTTKVEFMFGFNDEQLQRERAIRRLGTSEQEIMDDYSRRISRLGVASTCPL